MTALASSRDLSSVDVLFDDDAPSVQQAPQRTLVMDRRALGMPSSIPPSSVPHPLPQLSQADRTEETWASDADASPDSTQPARRILVAAERRWKRALGVAIFVSFAAGIAAAAGTQLALSPASGTSARSVRTPTAYVAAGVRHLEENGTTSKKEAAPPKKQKKKKAKTLTPASPAVEPAAEPAQEADAPAEVDANGLLNDGLGE